MRGPYEPLPHHRLLETGVGRGPEFSAGDIFQATAALNVPVPVEITLTALPAAAFLMAAVITARARYDPLLRLSLLLGTFTSVFIWSSLEITRPDVLGSIVLIAALSAGEAARSSDSRRWWAVAGATAAVAWLMTPWGIGLAGSAVLWIVLAAARMDRRRVVWRIGTLAAGVGAVILAVRLATGPDALQLAVTQTASFISQIALGPGYQTHRSAYQLFASPVREMTVRPLVLMLWPVMSAGVPCALAAPLLLLLRRGSRAFAAALVPPFALILGVPNMDDADWFRALLIPEVAMYFAAGFALLLAAASWASGRKQPQGRMVATVAAAALTIVVLQGIPARMGSVIDVHRGADTLARVRNAAHQLVTAGYVVAIAARTGWYTAGAQYVWDARNELRYQDSLAPNLESILDGADLATVDVGYRPGFDEGALLTGPYLTGRLNLASFVIATGPDDSFGHTTLFLSRGGAAAPHGYVLRGQSTEQFLSRSEGQVVLTFAACPASAVPADLDNRIFATSLPFAPREQDETAGSVIVVAMGSAAEVRAFFEPLAQDCRVRDQLIGVLVPAQISALSRTERPKTMTIVDDKEEAIRLAHKPERD